MKTPWVLVLALTVTGCAITDEVVHSHLAPSVSEDGSQRFTYAISSEISEIYTRSSGSVEATHKQWLARELAHRGFCMNGYIIDSVRTVDAATIYEGSCKK